MNKILYAFITLLAMTSCANSYNIQGTSNVSTLDGRMLYLKILKNNDFKNIDSCDVVHGQFHFDGNLDSVRMANIFMDDEAVLPLVLESGDINVKLDDAQQIVSGTPLNDKLFKFFKKYQQLQNQQMELVHKHDQAIMNGSDMEMVTRKLNEEAIRLADQEDKLVTSFVTENFDNVLGPGVFFMVTMRNQYPMLSPWIEDIMSKATDHFKNRRNQDAILSTFKAMESAIEQLLDNANVTYSKDETTSKKMEKLADKLNMESYLTEDLKKIVSLLKIPGEIRNKNAGHGSVDHPDVEDHLVKYEIDLVASSILFLARCCCRKDIKP